MEKLRATSHCTFYGSVIRITTRGVRKYVQRRNDVTSVEKTFLDDVQQCGFCFDVDFVLLSVDLNLLFVL